MIALSFRLFLGTMPESCTCTGVVTSKLLVRKGFIQSWNIYVPTLYFCFHFGSSFILLSFSCSPFEGRSISEVLYVSFDCYKFAGLIHFFLLSHRSFCRMMCRECSDFCKLVLSVSTNLKFSSGKCWE